MSEVFDPPTLLYCCLNNVAADKCNVICMAQIDLGWSQ